MTNNLRLINNLRIVVGILFRLIAFEGLRDNTKFLTSISSTGLRRKEFILIGGKNHENYFLSI